MVLLIVFTFGVAWRCMSCLARRPRLPLAVRSLDILALIAAYAPP